MGYSKHNKTGYNKAMRSALKEIIGERVTYLELNRSLGIHTNKGLNQFYKII